MDPKSSPNFINNYMSLHLTNELYWNICPYVNCTLNLREILKALEIWLTNGRIYVYMHLYSKILKEIYMNNSSYFTNIFTHAE